MPFADELLGPDQLTALADVLDRADPQFGTAPLRAVELTDLTLSGRVLAIRDALAMQVPDAVALDALLSAALDDTALTGWMIWPVTELVTLRTSTDPAGFDLGLQWLRRLTPRLTSEFAIRGFLLADLDRTLQVLTTWVDDPDEHVRRLVSEGTRARLPWGRRVPALTARPEAGIPLLDALVGDGSEYVRRSVANHLNDISRAAPDLAVATARRWLAADPASLPVVKHALRTLVKAGHREALSLLGFGDVTAIRVTGPVLEADRVDFPGRLEFEATVHNDGAQPAVLVVDQVVHYVKARGVRAEKVFKLTTMTLAAGESRVLRRGQDFRPLTTRRHHAGRHALQIQVNGTRHTLVEFDLVMPPV